MSARERMLVESIDRRRERASVKEERTARQKALQVRADTSLASDLETLPETDHEDYVEALAVSVRVQLVRLVGEPSAASILSQQAYEAGKNILHRKVARAEAERVFRKLPVAANDGGRS